MTNLTRLYLDGNNYDEEGLDYLRQSDFLEQLEYPVLEREEEEEEFEEEDEEEFEDIEEEDEEDEEEEIDDDENEFKN